MKILMICDLFLENKQYQENLLAKYYLKLGHEVTIVASTFNSIFDYYSENYKKHNKPQNYNIKGINIIRLPYSINIFNKIRKSKNLKSILKSKSPDFIFVHHVPLNLIEPISYKKGHPRCKVVYDFHADYNNSAHNWLSFYILHKVFYRIIMKIYYKKLDKIFYITPDVGTFVNQMYGIPKNKMILLPLGADTDYINELKAKGTDKDIREKLGINQSSFVIFSGGKLTKQKEIELVIEAFLLIKAQTAHLIIVGDTDDIEYKTRILNLINHHSRIHFIGWVDGEVVHDYMAACDIAVFPASQSVLWQQAIGSGLPLIIGQSKNQDLTYLNKNSNLFLIESGSMNANKIYSVIKLLIEDRILLDSMKMNSYKTAKEFLSYDIISGISLMS